MHDRHFFRTHFHAQVSARDHHAVGDGKNFFQVVDGFGFFELGDNGRVFSVAGDGGLPGSHVRGRSNEAQRNIIRAHLQRKVQVAAVLGSERRNFQFHARKIDALVFTQFPTVFDLADNFLPAGRDNAESDFAVVQENAVALANRLRQSAKGCADTLLGADHVLCGDHETLAEVQVHRLALRERARADFRPLQVGQNRNGLAVTRGGATHADRQPNFVLRGAV